LRSSIVDLEEKILSMKKIMQNLNEQIDERDQTTEEKNSYISDLNQEINGLKQKLQNTLKIEKEQVVTLIIKLLGLF
jgi:hypothetical protein